MSSELAVAAGASPSVDTGPPMVEVVGVSKVFHVYDRPQIHLRRALFGKVNDGGREFQALEPLDLTIHRGESVGVLGVNGSGKSTLLQIIAGTMQPTTGHVAVHGRISALLELGSGFNPEFTGRENVFLGASILGLRRPEIEARFDEIADFADIGEFIDQPVKVYSSGMYARLAFSVAIAVDPDVLIVDEILSVGDIAFQQRCVSRLREMRERGLTLLFVSHSVDSVKSVCGRAILLDRGHLVMDGGAERTVDHYLEMMRDRMNERRLRELGGRAPAPAAREVPATPAEGEPVAPLPTTPVAGRSSGAGGVTIVGVRLLDRSGEDQTAFFFGEPITVEVALASELDVDHLSASFLVRDGTGIDLTGTTTFEERVELPPLRPGQGCRVRFRFANVFRHGGYGISVAVVRVTRRDLSDVFVYHQLDAVAAFESIGRDERPVHYKFHLPTEIEVSPA